MLALLAVALSTGCSSPRAARPVDPAVAMLAGAARKAFDRGAVEQAAAQYGRALDRARAADDAAEIGNNAYNLAACRLVLGQPAPARPLLREARAAALRAGRPAADVLLLDAKAARQQGQTAEAAQLTDDLLRAPAVQGRAAWRLAALTLKAQLGCDAGRTPTQELAQVRILALDQTDPVLRAEVENLLGRVAQLDQEPRRAAASYDKEADWLQRGGRFREMAQALARAGAAYAQGGQAAEAANRLYRAARSLQAQGDTVGALTQIEPALQAARQARDDESARSIVSLFDEIKKSAATEKPVD
ncbi:MAG: hypothetical protein NTV49_01855 [Kiritimatiellaeota bacterium]|nr:hypothetical protein [Kiritimatiellota bacterium]